MVTDRDAIVVVGGGHAGAAVIAALRTEGYDGPLRFVSADAILPYHRPPLSKAFLKDPSATAQWIRPEAFYTENKVDLELGQIVLGLDRSAHSILLESGRRLSYGHLVLALGSKVRTLAIPGADLDGVVSLQSLGDALRLREALSAAQNVVIVGGGFIGLEVACTGIALGKRVTVLEAGPRLLGRAAAPEISAWLLDHHRAAGIGIRIGALPVRFIGDGRRLTGVALADGSSPIPADLVLVGIGAMPHTRLAGDAGLEVGDGIVVDDHMRTSDPAIFACGDGAAFDHWQTSRRLRIESVQNANDQGATVARGLVGHSNPYRAVPWFWSDQGPVRLQIVGLSHGADHRVVRGKEEDGSFSVFHFRDGRLAAIESLNRAADHMLGRRLLAGDATITPEVAADTSVDLKGYLKR